MVTEKAMPLKTLDEAEFLHLSLLMMMQNVIIHNHGTGVKVSDATIVEKAMLACHLAAERVASMGGEETMLIFEQRLHQIVMTMREEMQHQDA